MVYVIGAIAFIVVCIVPFIIEVIASDKVYKEKNKQRLKEEKIIKDMKKEK